MSGGAIILRCGGAGVCLALAVLLALPLRDASEGGHPPPVEPTSQTVEAVAQLLNETTDETAKDVAEEPGLFPGGDTCLIRHQLIDTLPQVDLDLRRQFALASATTHGADKLRRLDTLAQGAEGILGWRIALERATVALRAGQEADAGRPLAQAAAFGGIPDRCRADERFLAAAFAPPADRYALLKAAVALDPGHWQAHAELAMLLVARQDAGHCGDRAAVLLNSVVHLRQLTKNHRDLIRLAQQIEARTGSRAVAAKMAVMRGLFAEIGGRPDLAADIYRTALGSGAQDVCYADLRYGLERMLQDLERDL